MPRPRTATPGLCEPAQSKRTWTCHKSHSLRKFERSMPRAPTATSVLCEPAHSEPVRTCYESHFMRKFRRNMSYAPHRATCWACTFTCTWVCENLQENAARPGQGTGFARACAIGMHMDMSQEPIYERICRKMPYALARDWFWHVEVEDSKALGTSWWRPSWRWQNKVQRTSWCFRVRNCFVFFPFFICCSVRFPYTLQHFGTGSCHFNGIATFSSSNFHFAWYLQHFGAQTFHLGRHFATRVHLGVV